MFSAVRYVPEDIANHLFKIKPPLTIEGAHNVFLETIKRGEDDDFGSSNPFATTSVVLRLYEAFGGHARIKLNVASHLPVVKAVVTNLLEDDLEELQGQISESADHLGTSFKLDFRGFEVKTLKLTLRYSNWNHAQ